MASASLGFVPARGRSDFVNLAECRAQSQSQRLVAARSDRRPRITGLRDLGRCLRDAVIAEHQQVMSCHIHFFLRHIHSFLHFPGSGADEISVHKFA